MTPGGPPPSRELASFSRVTGPLRDLDLILERLRTRADRSSRSRRAGRARCELSAEHASLRSQLLRLLDGAEYRGLLDRLERPIEAAQQRPKHSLKRRAARELYDLVENVHELGRKPRSDDLHKIRLAVKRARYALELGETSEKRRTTHPRRRPHSPGDPRHLSGRVVTETHLRAAAAAAGNPSAALVAGSLIERHRHARTNLTEQVPAAWKQLRRSTRRGLRLGLSPNRHICAALTISAGSVLRARPGTGPRGRCGSRAASAPRVMAPPTPVASTAGIGSRHLPDTGTVRRSGTRGASREVGHCPHMEARAKSPRPGRTFDSFERATAGKSRRRSVRCCNSRSSRSRLAWRIR